MKEHNPLMMQMVNNVLAQCAVRPDGWAGRNTTNAEWAELLLAWDIPRYVRIYDC